MLEIAPDAIIAIDTKQCVRLFNRGAENIFGFKAAEVLGQPLDVLIPERFREGHAAAIGAFLSDKDESRMMTERGEIVGLRKDGSEFPAEASISKLHLNDDTTLTVMLHDITDRKDIEFGLVEAKENAEYANRSKSEFLANMSHELRTPLNAIIGFSDLMRQQAFGLFSNPNYEQYSSDIFESGTHLLNLINDILDLSVIESGRGKINESVFDISEAISFSKDIIRHRAEQSGHDLLIDKLAVGIQLRADERKFRQMLINLLSNAVKFTESGGKIAVSGDLQEDGALGITVTDNGIGIAAEDIPKAMSTLGQVDGALNRRYEGTGLGLPLVKLLAELHGGRFEIESEIGVGTNATIWFPKERVVRDG